MHTINQQFVLPYAMSAKIREVSHKNKMTKAQWFSLASLVLLELYGESTEGLCSDGAVLNHLALLRK